MWLKVPARSKSLTGSSLRLRISAAYGLQFRASEQTLETNPILSESLGTAIFAIDDADRPDYGCAEVSQI